MRPIWMPGTRPWAAHRQTCTSVESKIRATSTEVRTSGRWSYSSRENGLGTAKNNTVLHREGSLQIVATCPALSGLDGSVNHT